MKASKFTDAQKAFIIKQVTKSSIMPERLTAAGYFLDRKMNK